MYAKAMGLILLALSFPLHLGYSSFETCNIWGPHCPTLPTTHYLAWYLSNQQKNKAGKTVFFLLPVYGVNLAARSAQEETVVKKCDLVDLCCD